MKNKNIEIVYHYCGVDAFLSIISNAKLWLSDIYKANDSKECTWAKEAITNMIRDYMVQKEPEMFDKLMKWENEFAGSQPLYAACFSEKPDSLSQWRGYAQEGQGLAIGFSISFLISLNNKEKYAPYRFQKIAYGIEDSLNKFVIDEAVRIINCGAEKGLGHAAIALAHPNIEYAFFKNSSFEEEGEWRIACNVAKNFEKMWLGNTGMWVSQRCYRSPAGQIISYIEMDFSSVKQDIIREIWIGPKSRVTQDDIIDFLSDAGYYKNSDDLVEYNHEKPIPIIHSESSYR